MKERKANIWDFPWEIRQRLEALAASRRPPRPPATLEEVGQLYQKLYEEWKNGRLARSNKEKARVALLKKLIGELDA